MKPYIYNIKTHTLHIEGFCHLTRPNMQYGDSYKAFFTEDEAIAFDGRAVSLCKLCQKERDKRMLQNQKNN